MCPKDVWNTIVRSRLIWSADHPMHNLDVVVLGLFLYFCLIAFIAIMEDGYYCRWAKNYSREMSTTESNDLESCITETARSWRNLFMDWNLLVYLGAGISIPTVIVPGLGSFLFNVFFE